MNYFQWKPILLVYLLGNITSILSFSLNTSTLKFSQAVGTTTTKTITAFLPTISRTSQTSLYGKKEARAKGNDRKNKTERVKKQKDDVIEIEGVVLDSLPNAMFRVSINGASETQEPVLATISGKIRKNFVKILVGDAVTMELSPYDLTRGRITFRQKAGPRPS